MTQIYMIRHGESMSNLCGIFTGTLNSPLSETGLLQARLVASYFDNLHIDALYASDLDRAMTTVADIADFHKLEAIPTPALREINGGRLEGMTFAEIESVYPEENAAFRQDLGQLICPEGEAVAQLAERVFEAMTKIAKENEGKTVVVGTHAMPIRAMEAIVQLGSAEEMGRVDWVPNASITLYTYEDGKFTLVERGITVHLENLITHLPS